MATYNIDFYGRAKYGTATGVLYTAYPFYANEYQYGRLLLSWVSPQGDWTLFRLVKNLSGFASSQEDGQILVNLNRDVDGAPPTQYDDLDCVPGRFYYYSIFVGVGSSDPQAATWWRAANAMNIAVSDLGWTDRFWNWIPRIFQRGDDSTVLTDELTDENETLKRFLDIFGYQMNVLGTSGYALNQINDADTVSYQAIPSLGAQFGVDIEPELGPRIARTRVANATYINRLKGTEAGLEALISAATGWNADITYGLNQMLNSDQSSFVHPVYQQWNGAINYAVAERVVYNSNIYQANVGNYNQPPNTTRTNNTQWNYVGDTATSIENPMSRGQSTWGVFYMTPAAWEQNPNGNNTVRTSVGFQSATDPSVYASNALIVTNRSGVTTDMMASSVAPILSQAYSSATTYTLNNFASSGGINYRSLKSGNIGHTPATSPDWWKPTIRTVNTSVDPQQALADGIPIKTEDIGAQFTASAHVMAHAINGTGTPAAVKSIIQWYDDYGVPVGFVATSANPLAYDDFMLGTVGSNISSQAATTGATWGSQAAIARSGLGYVYRNTTTNGVYISLISTTDVDCVVAVTVRRFATIGGSAAAGNGLVGRWTDNNNYFRLGKNKLEIVQGVQLPAPTGLAASVQGSPGTTSTRFYTITATDASGETIQSSELTVPGTPTTYTGTQFVRLTWSAVTGATGYKIYRSLSSGAELLVQTVGAVTTVDDKATSGTSSPPGSNTTTVTATPSTLIDLSTTPSGVFTDGDRMALRFSGSNVYVLKNFVQIWTGTSTFNQSATRHGIWIGY